MTAAAPAAHYSTTAMILHWLSALLVIGLLVVGFVMDGLERDQIMLKFDLLQWHKSFGISLLLLTLFRLGWRLSVAPPPLEAAGWIKRSAALIHGLLYGLLVAMPLVGWAIVSVSPLQIPTRLYGVMPWPHLPFFDAVADKKATEHLFEEIHETMAFVLIAILVLHIGAALYHQFGLKDGLMHRMMPVRKGTS